MNPNPENAPAAEPSPDATASPIVRGIVTTSSLNVRSGPGASFPIAGEPLKAGVAFTVLEQQDGWLRMGDDQWVSARFVDVFHTVAGAIDRGTSTAASLNVRTGPAASFPLAGEPLEGGSEFPVMEQQGGWLRIGEGQWVSARYVKLRSKTEQAPAVVVKGTVTASRLNVRDRPSAEGALIDTLKAGERVSILAESNGWVNIGPSRWVSGKFVRQGATAPPQGVRPPSAADKPNWLKIAEGEIGQKEIKGPRHSLRVIEYHATTTGRFRDDETPWCSSFVNWVMMKAGKPRTENAMAMSWARYGKKLTKPALGAIVVFSYGRGRGHVGFVVGKQGKKIQVLGGNQNDMVKISAFSTVRVVAYVVPSDYVVPAAAYNLPEGRRADDSGGLAGTR